MREFWRFDLKIVLRGSQAVRATGVMVNLMQTERTHGKDIQDE
ncbi:hypothetical protein EJP617_E050 (plasmid) [Erwinia sp. Ejp617]|nr:hypothetical protein EJP617_E050 [Erwinia sp. Ejp617]